MKRLAALVLVSLSLTAAACGRDEAAEPTEPTSAAATEPETTEEPVAADPLTCLDEAGLDDVEERASDFWRGYHSNPFYQVGIERFASEAEARALARDAVDIYREQAGAYVVKGPAKPSAGGAVTEAEAAEAEQLLRRIATCLGG